MTNSQSHSSKRYVWLRWLTATAIARSAGVVISVVIINAVINEDFNYSLWLVSSLGSAVLVGFMQWALVLRHKLSGASWWIPAQVVGSVLAMALLHAAVALTPSTFFEIGRPGWILLSPIAGGIRALPEWWMLRQRVANAGWWVVVCTITGALSYVLVGSYGWSSNIQMTFVAALGAVHGLVSGAFSGAVTGVVMARLLDSKRSANSIQQEVATS